MPHGKNRGSDRGRRNLNRYGRVKASEKAVRDDVPLTPTQRKELKKLRTRKRRHFKGDDHPSL
jgi:hypothetical protein